MIHIKQILINLVNNAIKFTQYGRVKLIGRHLFEDTHHSKFKIDIIDTGIGIAKNKQDEIFTQFKQADKNILKKYGGTGLGLTICKQLVELMDGELQLTSSEGIGTVISIILTLIKSKKKEAIKESINPELICSKSFLAVDDDLANIMLIRTIFNSWKIKIDTAKNGKQALEKIKIKKYDLVFMDINMPVMSGLDVIERIRK
jgi:hypothetical protein